MDGLFLSHERLQTEAQTIAQKAVAAGIPGVQVDGMDVLGMLLKLLKRHVNLLLLVMDQC